MLTPPDSAVMDKLTTESPNDAITTSIIELNQLLDENDALIELRINNLNNITSRIDKLTLETGTFKSMRGRLTKLLEKLENEPPVLVQPERPSKSEHTLSPQDPSRGQLKEPKEREFRELSERETKELKEVPKETLRSFRDQNPNMSSHEPNTNRSFQENANRSFHDKSNRSYDDTIDPNASLLMNQTLNNSLILEEFTRDRDQSLTEAYESLTSIEGTAEPLETLDSLQNYLYSISNILKPSLRTTFSDIIVSTGELVRDTPLNGLNMRNLNDMISLIENTIGAFAD